MSRLWRNMKDTPEGKYHVTRRDGSTPEWSWFVLGERDPAAVDALIAYANRAEELQMDPAYVLDIRTMALDWSRQPTGASDPDAPPHRKDDPETIKKMRIGGSQ